MNRIFLSTLAALLAGTGLAHAETDPVKIASICAEAEARYAEIYGHPSAEEPGVTVALMYKYTVCPVTLEVPIDGGEHAALRTQTGEVAISASGENPRRFRPSALMP